MQRLIREHNVLITIIYLYGRFKIKRSKDVQMLICTDFPFIVLNKFKVVEEVRVNLFDIEKNNLLQNNVSMYDI